MTVKTIDHISIAVPDAKKASDLFTTLFGAKLEFTAESKDLECLMYFHTWGDKLVTIEQPTTETSTFNTFLKKHGPGIHHIAIEVDNVEQALAELKEKDVHTANAQLHGEFRREFLILPKDFFGILVQVIEWRGKCKGSLQEQLNLSRFGGIQIPTKSDDE